MGDTTTSALRSQRHLRELEALYRISQILAGQSRQKQALAEVLDVLHAELGMNRGTIVLLSPDAKELLIEVAHNLSDRQLRSIRYRMGEGITGRVVQTGKPAVVPKVSQEPLFLDRLHERRRLSQHEISFICVPNKGGLTPSGRELDELRPHEALQMTTTASCYTPSARAYPSRLEDHPYPSAWT